MIARRAGAVHGHARASRGQRPIRDRFCHDVARMRSCSFADARGWRPWTRAPLALSCLAVVLAGSMCGRGSDSGFRLLPYLQAPAPDAVTVLWLSHDGRPGRISYHRVGAGDWRTRTSAPEPAEALAPPSAAPAPDSGAGAGPGAGAGAGLGAGASAARHGPPYRHRVRLTGLVPDTVYEYEVTQGGARVRARFRTAPGPAGARPLRFIALADCEAEPESTGKHTIWPDPAGRAPGRRYPLDQTEGLARNLAVVRDRAPDLLIMAGDLVEAGGEQQDWDELWRQLTHVEGAHNLAAHVPIVAAPGNHEYYAGPGLGRYEQPVSEAAIRRFLTYFEAPAAGADDAGDGGGRYFRMDYGSVALIVLDVANGSPHQSERDTNYFLRGEADEGGGSAPDLGPGSRQRLWLEAQLRDAQATAAFTFVVLHHVPYSVGPHGWPPGPEPTGAEHTGRDPQSGVPLRALTELFLRHGVDAVLAGHDEMFERSEIAGTERLPHGAQRPHTLQVYDLGVCGDGLRAPEPGLSNPYQKFLAHSDAPERWQDGVLVDGGKHYGHLEVTVTPLSGSGWQAVLEPVYVFPRMQRDGSAIRVRDHERRVYDDVITLVSPGRR
jgi:3',5'-cyclic AMP phosphodiesterase CpdA